MRKTERLEARVAPADAERIRRAAAARQVSMGAFMVEAARSKADEVLVAQTESIVPADYFDRLVKALDEPPQVIPALAKALDRAAAHPVTRR